MKKSKIIVDYFYVDTHIQRVHKPAAKGKLFSKSYHMP